jgi:thymidylate kinase
MSLIAGEEPMRTTRLILLEGIPGSGKSTLGQFLARQLSVQGIPHRWWYEEEKAHPLYGFQDPASLQQLLDDLAGGEYHRVIAAALDKWRDVAATIASHDTTVVLESCLLGYLTWTLFPFDVPIAEIQVYLGEVEQLLQSLSPRLIYLYQADLAQALRIICERRGAQTRERLIRNATQSPYGRRMGLQGFEGLVMYWAAYRQLTDAACQASGFATLAIETGAGDWPTYQRQAQAFLRLPPPREAVIPPTDLAQCVGIYVQRDAAGAVRCAVTVQLEGDRLVVDGLPQVWPHTGLTATAANAFAIDSFPWSVVFVTDRTGAVEQMIVSGPELLFGAAPGPLAKERGVPTDGAN